MSLPYQLNAQRRSQFLQESVSRRFQISISIVTESGWNTYKSRFLGIDADNDQVILEYPAQKGQPVPEVAPLQNVGVSFRRGHKKCMFNSIILRRLEYHLGGDARTPALAIARPTNMFELQRRLFHRVAVPEGVRITVNASRAGAEREPSIDPEYAGAMLDLSAGGLSFEIEGDRTPDWTENTPVRCRFDDGEGRTIEATAQFRYCESSEAGQARVGLQFAGLEASVAGRATLQDILAMTRRLQQM